MYRNFQNHCVFIQLNIGYIGIVVNLKTVEILKKKYNLGDIISFKVIELDQNKKRYVLDIYNNNTEYVKENNNTQELSTTSLNVCEKSFYPRSYLKLVEGNNNNNNINSNNSNTNNTEYTKPTSLYDLLNSKDNNYVISVNVNSFSSAANNNNNTNTNNHNINYKKINNTNIEKSNYNKKK
jgi:hypothetical protein